MKNIYLIFILFLSTSYGETALENFRNCCYEQNESGAIEAESSADMLIKISALLGRIVDEAEILPNDDGGHVVVSSEIIWKIFLEGALQEGSINSIRAAITEPVVSLGLILNIFSEGALQEGSINSIRAAIAQPGDTQCSSEDAESLLFDNDGLLKVQQMFRDLSHSNKKLLAKINMLLLSELEIQNRECVYTVNGVQLSQNQCILAFFCLKSISILNEMLLFE